ncbi:MAG: hypothetical protein EA412_07820 [Chitinophagaceae bacterium]|nr:MAG: hypothetical protein EA412_07820 [Chitinophagaceae bacterium]
MLFSIIIFPFPALSIQEIITRDLGASTKSNIYGSRAHNDGSFLGFPFYERANNIATFEFLNSWNLVSWGESCLQINTETLRCHSE